MFTFLISFSSFAKAKLNKQSQPNGESAEFLTVTVTVTTLLLSKEVINGKSNCNCNPLQSLLQGNDK